MNKYTDMQRPQSSKFKMRTILKSPNEKNLEPSSSIKTLYSCKSLSPLSQIVNERIGKINEDLFLKTLPYNEQLLKKNFPTSKLSEKDFERLMSKLETVMPSDNSNSKKLFMTDNLPIEVTIKAGKTQYFKLKVQGKKTPVKFEINKSYGNLRTYVSKATPEPNESNHDEFSQSNQFQVTDTHITFKFDHLYIGIQALENSSFSILAKFGHEKKKVCHYKNQGTDNLNRKKSVLPSNSCKNNLMRKNARIATSKSPEIGIKKKNEVWQIRRVEAVKKKSAGIKQKREKTLLVLHRNSQTKPKTSPKDFNMKNHILTVTQRVWIVIIYLAVTINSFKSSIAHRNNIVDLNSKQVASASIIQKHFKAHLHLPINLALLRSKSILKLYYSSKRNNKKLSKCIVKFVKESAETLKTNEAFADYMDKIIKIQRYWRLSQKNSERILKNLKNYWNKAMSSLIAGIDIPPRVKHLNLIKDPSVYVSITKERRNSLLKRFILQKKFFYVQKLRNFYYQPNNEVGVPSLELVPSELEMFKILEEAINT